MLTDLKDQNTDAKTMARHFDSKTPLSPRVPQDDNFSTRLAIKWPLYIIHTRRKAMQRCHFTNKFTEWRSRRSLTFVARGNQPISTHSAGQTLSALQGGATPLGLRCSPMSFGLRSERAIASRWLSSQGRFNWQAIESENSHTGVWASFL